MSLTYLVIIKDVWVSDGLMNELGIISVSSVYKCWFISTFLCTRVYLASLLTVGPEMSWGSPFRARSQSDHVTRGAGGTVPGGQWNGLCGGRLLPSPGGQPGGRRSRGGRLYRVSVPRVAVSRRGWQMCEDSLRWERYGRLEVSLWIQDVSMT